MRGHADRAVTTPLPRLPTTVSAAAVNANHILTPPADPQRRPRRRNVGRVQLLRGNESGGCTAGARGCTPRSRHDPPAGQRAVTTNGWKAVDELELIMRRWRATLDHSKKSEVTLGKR